MKAIKIEMVVLDSPDGEYFVTQTLPKLKEEHKVIKQIHYCKCEYFEE